MKKIEKLKLQNLNIKSFATTLNQKQEQQIYGGTYGQICLGTTCPWTGC